VPWPSGDRAAMSVAPRTAPPGSADVAAVALGMHSVTERHTGEACISPDRGTVVVLRHLLVAAPPQGRPPDPPVGALQTGLCDLSAARGATAGQELRALHQPVRCRSRLAAKDWRWPAACRHDGRPLADREVRRAGVLGQHREPQCADRAGPSRPAESLRAPGRPRRRAVTGRARTASRAGSHGLLRPPGAAVGTDTTQDPPTRETRTAARTGRTRTSPSKQVHPEGSGEQSRQHGLRVFRRDFSPALGSRGGPQADAGPVARRATVSRPKKR
jgi:hypothetical protein